MDSLDRYLRMQAGQDIRRKANGVFILVEIARPSVVLGYYTLSAFAVEVTELPETLQKNLPHYPRLPATLLGRLARDERFPGVGSLLLVDALARAHKQSEQIASLAVIADAKDEAALNFYRKFGFAALGSHPNRVFLPKGTVTELLQLKR